METIDDSLAKWIINQMDARGWSQRRLASEAGLSHTQVSNVISGNRTITFDFCAAIAKPLGKTPEEVFRLAGLLPPLPAQVESVRGLAGEEKELIAIWRGLPAADKECLLRLVRMLDEAVKRDEEGESRRRGR